MNIEQYIPVMEHFYTIQGEGEFAGQSAYFIRLAGCDIGCVWCDVKDSWTVSKQQYMSYTEILGHIKQTKAKTVVVTGGEPTIYNLSYLTNILKAQHYITHIETAFTRKITGQWDWICFSPKKFAPPHETAYIYANALKIIIYNTHDFKWAEQQKQHLQNPSTTCFLQPEFSKQKHMLPFIIEYVKEHPEWRISLQTHKYMNIP